MIHRLPTLVMITGAPGAGKSTTAMALAPKLEPVAEVYAGEIRHRLRPYEFPWKEPEGKKQFRLGVDSACAVARIYLSNNYNVIMNDVLIPEAYVKYKKLLSDFDGITILLKPPLKTALIRNKAREKTIPEERIIEAYKYFESFEPNKFNMILDNGEQSLNEVTERILQYIKGIPRRR